MVDNYGVGSGSKIKYVIIPGYILHTYELVLYVDTHHDIMYESYYYYTSVVIAMNTLLVVLVLDLAIRHK